MRLIATCLAAVAALTSAVPSIRANRATDAVSINAGQPALPAAPLLHNPVQKDPTYGVSCKRMIFEKDADGKEVEADVESAQVGCGNTCTFDRTEFGKNECTASSWHLMITILNSRSQEYQSALWQHMNEFKAQETGIPECEQFCKEHNKEWEKSVPGQLLKYGHPLWQMGMRDGMWGSSLEAMKAHVTNPDNAKSTWKKPYADSVYAQGEATYRRLLRWVHSDAAPLRKLLEELFIFRKGNGEAWPVPLINFAYDLWPLSIKSPIPEPQGGLAYAKLRDEVLATTNSEAWRKAGKAAYEALRLDAPAPEMEPVKAELATTRQMLDRSYPESFMHMDSRFTCGRLRSLLGDSSEYLGGAIAKEAPIHTALAGLYEQLPAMKAAMESGLKKTQELLDKEASANMKTWYERRIGALKLDLKLLGDLEARLCKAFNGAACASEAKRNEFAANLIFTAEALCEFRGYHVFSGMLTINGSKRGFGNWFGTTMKKFLEEAETWAAATEKEDKGAVTRRASSLADWKEGWFPAA